jgi:S-DNA-T family DNA segregation ATPase FtsK/SpoIIIE
VDAAVVAAALADYLGMDPTRALRVAVAETGAELARGRRLADLQLRHGDRLVIGSPSAEAKTEGVATVRLAVVGGPAAGAEFELPDGEHLLGRDPQHCDITIDDPSISARHARLTVNRSGITLTDVGSSNGTAVNGKGVSPGVAQAIAPRDVIRCGRSLLSFEATAKGRVRVHPSENGYIDFNRPPRHTERIDLTPMRLSLPPVESTRSRLPIVAILLPLLVAGALFFVMDQNPQMLLFALLTPVMAIGSVIEERMSRRADARQREKDFSSELSRVDAELRARRAQEQDDVRRLAPDAHRLLERIRTQSVDLWERRPSDVDFLWLRIGTGSSPSRVSLEVEGDTRDPLALRASEIDERTRMLDAVPCVADLTKLGVLGISGPEAATTNLARWLALQIAGLHSPSDVVLAVAYGEATTEQWDWLKWLPHVSSPLAELRNLLVAGGPVATRELMDALEQLAGRRRAARANLFELAGPTPTPHIVLLLSYDAGVSEAQFGRIFSDVTAGMSAVVLRRTRDELPGVSRGIAEVGESAAVLRWIDTVAHARSDDVHADGVAATMAEGAALRLAPLRDRASEATKGEIPTFVSLEDVLSPSAFDPQSLRQTWEGAGGGLSAPIGSSQVGQFDLDLRRDGPHALVAGTTGSGKSELLQTVVAGLAMEYSPQRLNFLLVDYKGGAAFSACVALPHTVGFVTDLDEHLTYRALISLNAELRYREARLKALGAKDLTTAILQSPAEAPASLVIVIDEFATLAKEVPDFVEGVVDVAQRGRSLGVHLVLATQRPAGVVSAAIRANTNLRVALRVSDPVESDDVIGAPDAAHIPRETPGRAFARTGHSELTEFQAAYAGATLRRDEADGPLVSITPFMAGRGRASGSSQSPAESVTVLNSVVSTAVQAARGMPAPRTPWLPPLPSTIPLQDLRPQSGEGAPIALMDRPSSQEQLVFEFRPAGHGSLLVFGSASSGKSMALTSCAAALASRLSPDELHIYGLDFGARGISSLERLPHCGGVIAAADIERAERVMARMRRHVNERRALMATHNCSTYEELVAATDSPLPLVVVALDNYEGFAATFERVNFGRLVDELPQLVMDGRAVGIHFLISAERRGSVPTPLFSAIPVRIVLRMADEDEFAALGVTRQQIGPHLGTPGRGFIEGLEAQVAHPGETADSAGVAAGIDAIAAEYRSVDWAHRAPLVRSLPTDLALPTGHITAEPWSAVLGMSATDLEWVSVDLADGGFIVLGGPGSGKSTALATLTTSLLQSTPELRADLVATDPDNRLLSVRWDAVARTVDEAADVIQMLLGSDSSQPSLLVIDGAHEFFESDLSSSLDQLVAQGQARGARVLIAADAHTASRAYDAWVLGLIRSRRALFLMPDDGSGDAEVLGIRLPSTDSRPMPGRGYLLLGPNAPQLVQVARADPESPGSRSSEG